MSSLTGTDNLYDGLSTLNKDGSPPSTRLSSAQDTRNLVQLVMQKDSERSKKRALVKGLVDGNPPYKRSNLVNSGRADACNVNWRVAGAYLDAALGAFYDVFHEAPTYATVESRYGDPDKRQEWSGIISEEFDRLQHDDKSFDYHMQISQYEMVLYGDGPMFFHDTVDWRCRSVQCKNLLTLDNAKSDVCNWELGIILSEYKPHELYEMIQNEAFSKAIGWDVEFVKKVIINSHPKSREGGSWRTWEYHQQMLKNSSFYYSETSRTIQVAHVLFKEFAKEGEITGRVSHKIVLQNTWENAEEKFLFESVGRFKEWTNTLHPMYYDHGGGGEHHSVTGMGVKMYAAMEYQNRLLCRLADDAFAPKILFKPTTGQASQNLSVAHFGQYGAVPPGLDIQPIPINGYMKDGLEFNREITGLVSSNLSQYRQDLQQQTGNPITATEASYRQSEQSRLGKTQLNRYYEQLDDLYAEKYRRASNPNLSESMPGGREALEFQQRCKDRGVPDQALVLIERVQATRIAGQGSPQMRQQALEKLLGLMGGFPESGRDNLIMDVIAASTGQSSVKRYYPRPPSMNMATDQHAMALLQVAAMKDSVPPVVTSTQNPVIFAQTFLQAGSQAAASLQQIQDPQELLQKEMEVSAFLDLIGAGAQAHIQRMANDPTRKQVVDALSEQLKKLAKFADQLKQKIQQDMEQQAQAQQAQQKQVADGIAKLTKQLGNGNDPKATAEIVALQRKTESDLEHAREHLNMQRETHQMKMLEARQSMAISDASTAADITLKKRMAEARIKRESQTSNNSDTSSSGNKLNRYKIKRV